MLTNRVSSGSSSARVAAKVTREFELHILFVCTGNICRSPTAERLATAQIAGFRSADITAASAGTRAVIGAAIHPDAAAVLEELGGDASDFSARQLTLRVANGADLVLTMTRSHRDKVLELAPRLLRRVFTLAEAAELTALGNPESVLELASLRPMLEAQAASSDIRDPIGASAEVFADVGAQIADLLPPVIDFCRRTIPPQLSG